MPLREYQCKKCGHTFENLEFTPEDEQKTCQKCGSDKIIQLLSAFSISKGSNTMPRCSDGSCCSSCSGTGCPYSGDLED